MWTCLATKRCIVSGCAKLAGNGERRTNTGNAGKMMPLLISRFRNILANLKSTTVQHFLYISSINLDFLIRAISTKTPKQLRNNLICLHTPVALLASKLIVASDRNTVRFEVAFDVLPAFCSSNTQIASYSCTF